MNIHIVLIYHHLDFASWSVTRQIPERINNNKTESEEDGGPHSSPVEMTLIEIWNLYFKLCQTFVLCEWSYLNISILFYFQRSLIKKKTVFFFMLFYLWCFIALLCPTVQCWFCLIFISSGVFQINCTADFRLLRAIREGCKFLFCCADFGWYLTLCWLNVLEVCVIFRYLIIVFIDYECQRKAGWMFFCQPTNDEHFSKMRWHVD